jgi:antitoxin (DNA-binding transcriptional repressor) of toxin-antitoxin stability system
MLTKTIDVQEAKKELKELLSLVVAGTEIIFIDGNTPIARLISAGRRVAGLHAGAVWTSQDFDEPLPEEFWVKTRLTVC